MTGLAVAGARPLTLTDPGDDLIGYDHLADRLRDGGHDVAAVERALAALVIETPSWGYGDSGTRFAVFQQPGRPRDVFERLDDAAEVHRLTGAAPVRGAALPVGPRRRLRRAARATPTSLGLRGRRASTPTSSRTPTTSSGRSPTPTRPCAARRSTTCSSAWRSRRALGSTAQSLWLADGTNYPGQDDLRARRRADGRRAAARCTRRCPPSRSCCVEYKLFEPAFYATDLADWGSALLVCQKLGDRARVLVDLGHHAQGANIEQIVAMLPTRAASAASTSTTASTPTTT